MRALVWFRSDLRVGDNPALYHACRASDRGVIGVYTICPAQWREHDWGHPKVDFILRNLAALSAALHGLRIPLLIVERPRFANVHQSLLELATEHACDALYFNREYEVNEQRRDRRVEEAFKQSGRKVQAFDDQLILPPGSVLTRQNTPYTVYSAFRRKWLDVYDARRSQILGRPRRQPARAAKRDDVPAQIEPFAGQARSDLWPAGEAHARARLRGFLRRDVRQYDRDRDVPNVNGTSKLSPYLSLGVLSPREALHGAVEANDGRIAGGLAGIDAWINELIWREFYRHILVGFPRICMNRPFQLETARIRWSRSDKRYRAWCEGRTGVPIVDAGMRQLNETGWMHNRLRMITAMFLTKDLLIDWRWGEKYFMQHLIDADLASNNGGWQWAASTGTDAAPYFRVFNPFTQSRRFDPQGEYIRRFVPELAKLDGRTIHEPHRLGRRRDLDYPPPIVSHKLARERAIRAFAGLRKGKRT